MLLGCSGGLVAAKFVKCPKSYYTEQFEKYGYIRDKYDTLYNTPTPYDLSLPARITTSTCPACPEFRMQHSSQGSISVAITERQTLPVTRQCLACVCVYVCVCVCACVRVCVLLQAAGPAAFLLF